MRKCRAEHRDADAHEEEGAAPDGGEGEQLDEVLESPWEALVLVGTSRHCRRAARRVPPESCGLSLEVRGEESGTNYCSGPMKYKVPVIPAKAGIQCRSAIADWTPAFAGVTNSNINGPDQYPFVRYWDDSSGLLGDRLLCSAPDARASPFLWLLSFGDRQTKRKNARASGAENSTSTKARFVILRSASDRWQMAHPFDPRKNQDPLQTRKKSSPSSCYNITGAKTLGLCRSWL
jgi:hypothetical protein